MNISSSSGNGGTTDQRSEIDMPEQGKEHSPQEQQDINMTVIGIQATLEHNKIPVEIAASALMVLSATYAACTIESDEYLIEEYKKCLLQCE